MLAKTCRYARRWSRAMEFMPDTGGPVCIVRASQWRWVMLAVLCLDICVSYLPYYTFVPILRQSMQVYGVDEAALNVLCIIYALVYVPGAFLTGPIVSAVGCRWTFVLATSLMTLGCLIRCGPKFIGGYFPAIAGVLEPPGIVETHSVNGTADIVVAIPTVMSFTWLMVGQAVCALGQPFLVNSTSKMGAEWFPPDERPTAAMVSNLMNYIGGSLSFMLPPLVVEDQPNNLEVAESQMLSLLRFQLVVAAGSLILTLSLYKQAPLIRAVPRIPVSFAREVRDVLVLKDFWLMNVQFAIYIAIGHAFDAVEGSLLEHYGYSAALTSWTGVSCAVASIVSTFFEARFITNPSFYRAAIFVANAFLAASQIIGFLCLHFHLHESMFVLAVGIMGLATPGWGCSCELGSEVCFPAQEATVSSLLEVFSNLFAVVAIMVTQRLIDVGFGAYVLVILAAFAIFGGSLLLGLNGTLWRSEAEAAGADAEGKDLILRSKAPLAALDSSKQARPGQFRTLVFGKLQARFGPFPNAKSCESQMRISRAGCFALLAICVVGPIAGSLMLTTPQQVTIHSSGPRAALSQQAWNPQLSPQLYVATTSGPLNAARPGKKHRDEVVLANGLPQPRNFVIHCPEDEHRIEMFHKAMRDANLEYQVFPCVRATSSTVQEAVLEGLLPPSAAEATIGMTRMGQSRALQLGAAIAHLRLMKAIVRTKTKLANVFEDTERVYNKFLVRRNTLLGHLPKGIDLVNLNVLRPAGDHMKFKRAKLTNESSWMRGAVFRVRPGLSPLTNGWMSNYVVTQRGAQKILDFGRGYDTFGKWESFDAYINSQVYAILDRRSFIAYVVKTNKLSVHCERGGYYLGRPGVKDRKQKQICAI